MTQTYDPRDAATSLTSHGVESTIEGAARVAAAALGAPAGIVCLTRPYAASVSGPHQRAALGPPVGSSAWYTLLSRLVEHTVAPVAIEDLLDHPLAAGLDQADLGGLASFVGVPIRDDDGDVRGLVGAFDMSRRRWTTHEQDVLEDLGHLALPRPPASPGGPTQAPGRDHEIVRLAGELAHTVSAVADGFRGLVTHAAANHDPVLQRRAGVAERQLDVLGVQAMRLRSGAIEAWAGARAEALFDLRPVVAAAVREAAAAVRTPQFNVEMPKGPLSVAGHPAAVKRALVTLFSTALIAAPAQSVTVRLQGLAVSSGALDGSLTAELRLTTRGTALSVGDLARGVAGLLDPDSGVVGPSASARVRHSPGEVAIEAPGLRASSTVDGTRVTARWPVDLG